ncbi:MAG: hypothetical protein LUG89_01205 [Methanosphaera sp.]|nr:hypothetical protein [Methanosphaera sp.]
MYSGTNYDRVDENTTFAVTKSDVVAQISPLYSTQGENATITMTIYGENGVQIDRDTKVSIKINGKTYLSTTSTSGVLNVEIPTNTLATGYYNVTVIFGENSQYNTLRLESVLVITSQTTDSDNGTLIEE